MSVVRVKEIAGYNLTKQKALLRTAVINNWKNVYKPREDELEAVSQEQVNELKNFFELE